MKLNLILKMCIQTDQVNLKSCASDLYALSSWLACFCYCGVIEEILVSLSSGDMEWSHRTNRTGITEMQKDICHRVLKTKYLFDHNERFCSMRAGIHQKRQIGGKRQSMKI